MAKYIWKVGGHPLYAERAEATRSGVNLDEALAAKANKVVSATSGNFAGLDENGDLIDSNSKASDFATASQGNKADSAVQSVKLTGTGSELNNSGAVVIPAASSSAKGVVQLATSIGATETNNTKAVTPKAVRDAIDSTVSSAYHAAGTKTCAQLTSSLLVAANAGDVYNMTDSGTTTSDFVEGQGKPIRAGDNVGICAVDESGTTVYKFDLLSGFVDLSGYVSKSGTSGLLRNDGTVDTSSYLTTTGNASNVTSTFTKDSSDESTMSSGGKLSAIFTAISGFFAELLGKWREGINSRPGAVSRGYTHLGTMTVTDGNKRAMLAFEVFCGKKASVPNRMEAMVGVDGISTVNAAYSSECVSSGSERNRFKLCYKFASDSTTEAPKIEIWLIDTGVAGTDTRRCACNIHIVKGFTWEEGNSSVDALPENLVDFVLATRQGQLTIAEGGTAASTAKGAEYNITPNLATELKTKPMDTYKIPFIASSASDSNGRFAGYREMLTVWGYFKDKADAAYAALNHSHGSITKDGKVGTSSGKPLITTTGGAVTTGEFGMSAGQFAEGDHNHTHINGNANGYAKATGSAVRGLLDLGKFSYSSNLDFSATFRISYTDARQYAPVEILLRLQIKYNGNATDGIVSISSDSKFYAYKIRSGQNRNTTDYGCYIRIIDGELHVLVGMTSTTTAQANIVVRCLWNVQSFRSPFTMLNEAIEELPDYTSMIVVPKFHMAYADAAGADGAPVTVDKYGKLLPLDSIQATSVGYLRLDGTVDDFDTYSVMVMDADGVVYKDASVYKKLSYRAQDNCIGSNIDGWATMLEPKALSSIPSEAPDILHVPLLDSSRYVRIDKSSTPTRMVYSRSTNTLSVNINGKVNGKTFVFGAYGGELNTVYFC